MGPVEKPVDKVTEKNVDQKNSLVQVFSDLVITSTQQDYFIEFTIS